MIVPNVPFQRVWEFNQRRNPALTVQTFSWGFLWAGTREQLIGAQLVQDGQFPGDPGRGSTSVRFPDAGPGELDQVHRTSARKFQAHVRATPVDRLLYESLKAAQSQRRDCFELSIQRVREGGAS